ncbi:acylphosphatase [Vibrio artabrorum]|uniref:acylphosphatase n=1 Tax=Vibrio TaxID=662 RepID=UPI00354DD175
MRNSRFIFVVSGIVQCVGFRYHTRKQAQALGISGYAKNLSDGRVEVLAVGDIVQINTLYDWLQIGPASAKVDRVIKREIEDTNEQMISSGEFKIL